MNLSRLLSTAVCAKIFHSLWKFDNVLTKLILHSFFETRCSETRGINPVINSARPLSLLHGTLGP